MRIEIRKGDITKVEADCIVNAANSLGIMGGGVAGALRRAGGEEIDREARAKAPIPVGEAVATTAGRLNARYVIHAPTMERPAMPSSPEKIHAATRAALRVAEECGCRSVAIPGMGTGVGGVSPHDAARAMVSALREFEQSPTIETVILMDIGDAMVEAWRNALAETYGDAT